MTSAATFFPANVIPFASGAAQTTCNSMTDSATVTVMLKGSLETPNFSASIDREGMWTITGLQSATATLDGSASFSLDTTIKSVFHPGVTSTFSFDNSATYKAITVTTADREITGGSASFEVKAHRTRPVADVLMRCGPAGLHADSQSRRRGVYIRAVGAAVGEDHLRFDVVVPPARAHLDDAEVVDVPAGHAGLLTSTQAGGAVCLALLHAEELRATSST